MYEYAFYVLYRCEHYQNLNDGRRYDKTHDSMKYNDFYKPIWNITLYKLTSFPITVLLIEWIL